MLLIYPMINKGINSKKEKINEILDILATAYPDAGTALVYETPFELMAAAILSAQCTDKQVNRVTAKLFKKYNTPQEFATLSQDDLAEDIKGCGLYRNKSRYIIEASRELIKRYGGLVPQNRKELESLPGVGSKTAGVISGVIYGSSALPVDTHVHRIAHRLGLSRASNPGKVEEELAIYIAPQRRMAAHHRLIAHGRKVCSSRRPACGNCCLVKFCQYRPKEDKHSCI